MKQRDSMLRNLIQRNTHRNVLYLDLNIRKVVSENENSTQISSEMKQWANKNKNHQNTLSIKINDK